MEKFKADLLEEANELKRKVQTKSDKVKTLREKIDNESNKG